MTSEDQTTPQSPAQEIGTHDPRPTDDPGRDKQHNKESRNAAEKSEAETDEIIFLIEISARYHNRRRAFIDLWHRILMLITIMTGSIAAADLLGYVKYLAFAAAFFAALDLVFALSDKARDHEFLYRSFGQLLAEIRSTSNPTENDIRQWQIKKIEIEADEPAIFWALQALCYNEAIHATDREEEGFELKSRWYEKLLKNYIRFSSSTITSSPRPYFKRRRARKGSTPSA